MIGTLLRFGVFLTAVQSWSTTGPPGRPNALAVDPTNESRVYASGALGVYRSLDGGRSWAITSLRVPGVAIGELAVSPENPSVIYALPSGQQLARSDDGGDTWTLSDQIPRAGNLTLDPRRPDTVFLSGFVSENPLIPGVVRSVDGGRTWQVAFSTPFQIPPLLAAGSNAEGNVFAINPLGVGERTTDGGESWLSVASLFPFPTSEEFKSVVVDTSMPSVSAGLFAATDLRLFRLADPGAAWTVAGPVPPGILAAASIEGLFARSDQGLFKSSDHGASWRTVLTEPVSTVALGRQGSGVVFAGAGFDVWRSEDAGETFEATGADVINGGGRLFLDASHRVFSVPVGSLGALSVRDDTGRWTVLSEVPDHQAFALDPNDPSTEYIVRVSTPTFCAPLEKSIDAGHTWTSLGFPACGTLALAVDPSDSRRVVLLKSDGVWVSRQGGANFVRAYTFPVRPAYQVTFDPARPGRIYVGFLRSLDGGINWSPGAVPCETDPADCRAYDLAVNPAKGTIYSLTSMGLAVSRDFEATWTSLPADGAPFINGMDVNSRTGELFAATVNGVFRSSDAGFHFVALDPEHLSGNVSYVKVRSSDGTIFASARGAVWELDAEPTRRTPILPGRGRSDTVIVPPAPARVGE